MSRPKSADFGLSHAYAQNELLSAPCGSLHYVTPEIILRHEYEEDAADVWSLRVVLYVTTTGALPWTEEDTQEICEQIVSGKYWISPDFSLELQDLIRGMMNVDAKERLTLQQGKDHPWLRGMVPECKPAPAIPDSPIPDTWPPAKSDLYSKALALLSPVSPESGHPKTNEWKKIATKVVGQSESAKPRLPPSPSDLESERSLPDN
jgi:serine/threonine protein kinase